MRSALELSTIALYLALYVCEWNTHHNNMAETIRIAACRSLT